MECVCRKYSSLPLGQMSGPSGPGIIASSFWWQMPGPLGPGISVTPFGGQLLGQVFGHRFPIGVPVLERFCCKATWWFCGGSSCAGRSFVLWRLYAFPPPLVQAWGLVCLYDYDGFSLRLGVRKSPSPRSCSCVSSCCWPPGYSADYRGFTSSRSDSALPLAAGLPGFLLHRPYADKALGFVAGGLCSMNVHRYAVEACGFVACVRSWLKKCPADSRYPPHAVKAVGFDAGWCDRCGHAPHAI